mmetsp:Transcript_11096/g.33264  ORF Transcript_11096/g.33264 Transcript_11096/m.33264 type:complete len:112 (-) Transcript_11096:1646-1981(-)
MAPKQNPSMEFQPETWKTKSAKFGASFKSASSTGATATKTAAMNTSQSVKQKDWTKEKQGAAKAGTAMKNGVVTGATATKDGSVKAFGWLASKIKGSGDKKPGSNTQLSGH